MSFRELLARLGAKALARRLGVTAATVRRWSRQGLSGVGKALLAELRAREHRRAQAAQRRAEREEEERRRLAALRAKRTRRKRKKFQEEVTPPFETELPLKDVMPKEAPRPERAAEGEFKYQRIGTRNFDTSTYEGTTTTVQVGQPAHEVDWAQLARTAGAIYQQSRRMFGRAIFLFFRYIPFNPLYRGRLIHNQGKWVDFWSSTAVQNTYDRVVDGVMAIMDWLVEQRKGMLVRMIWLEQVQVQSFDYRGDEPSGRRVMSTVVS